jgi:conjugative relaxase-like TrwC/TraI family protein
VIGFAQIIGGKPSAVGGMTDHLMNKTLRLGAEEARLAAYYGRGQVRDEQLMALARQVADGSLTLPEATDAWFERHPQKIQPMASLPPARSDLEHWAREVARGYADFEDVLDRLVTAEMDRDQVGGFLEIEERVGTQLLEAITAAEREMLAEPQEAEERVSRRLDSMAGRIRDGLENAPVAVIRPDLHPMVASGLGIDPDALLSKAQINALLAGRRADGEQIDGKHYAKVRSLPVNPKTGERNLSHPIGSYDFCPTPDKSVSVAWAFANPVERARIFNAHIESAREAIATTVAEHIGQARFGKAGQEGREPGRVAWLEFTHHTARRVMVNIRDGEVAEMKHDASASGDPDLHTHFLIPNAVFCESGRVGSLDTAAVAGMIFKADAEYHARLGQKLRDAGFSVALDPDTGAARMTAIPQDVSALFSKRTNIGEQWARLMAARSGVVWDDLTKEQRDFQIKRYTQDTTLQRSKGQKDDVANFADWRRQAKDFGWEAPSSLMRQGPEQDLTHEQRLRRAYEIALPFLAEKFARKAVLTHWDIKVAAARGLVDTGSRDVPADVLTLTRMMREEGVQQYGEQTMLVWGPEPGKRVISITTALHASQEEDFVRLAKTAAGDRSAALPAGLLRQKIEQSGLDFTGSHGAAQRDAIERLGTGGRFGLAIAAAGAGKTTALKPLVAAWREQGREVYGASLAWRQADDLTQAGIGRNNVKAFSVLIDAIRDGSIKPGRNAVIAVDEWGLLGTRQALELLRLQERHGFSVVALGDDKQATSVEAGAIIDLSRRALGAEQVPEILTTRRQETERERTIAGLFREGRAAEALDMKRADGTAIMAYGGYDGVVERVARLYAERLTTTGEAPTISAPTNHDAHRIGETVRDERRKMGLLGPDLRTIRATDGERDYTMRLAAGDRVRLFRSTGAKYGQGRGGAIGRNGSMLEVVDVDDSGITLRTRQGRVGTVRWQDMAKQHGRVQLAYGYAMTIHTAQGTTTHEHISALPAGSQAIDGLLGYSANTRHRQKVYLVTNESAEHVAVSKRRPLNDTREVTTDDKWANVARVLSHQPEKDNALSMFDRVATIRRGAVRAFHDLAHQTIRQSRSIGPDVATRQMQGRSLGDDLRVAMRHTIETVQRAVDKARGMLHERYEQRDRGPSLGR